MMPNNRDLIWSIRRERATDATAGTLVDPETLVNLAPPCTWLGHATGETGCEPDAPAEFVVRVRPHCGPNANTPSIVLVCHAQYLRITRWANTPTVCSDCGGFTTPGAHIDRLGRVDEYYP